MNPVQEAVYTLVKKFAQRQSIVLDALKDLRPDLILSAEHDDDDDEFWTEWTPEKWSAFVWEVKHRPPAGEWGDNKEWKYFLHGAGCRLTHKVTGECIEWDFGSLQQFDKNWFAYYLESILDHDSDGALTILREWHESEQKLNPNVNTIHRPFHQAVLTILEQLHQMGLLSHDEQYYTLLTEEESKS